MLSYAPVTVLKSYEITKEYEKCFVKAVENN